LKLYTRKRERKKDAKERKMRKKEKRKTLKKVITNQSAGFKHTA